MESVWDKADSNAALMEGWDIFDCHGSTSGPYQICTLEEPYLLEWLGYDDKKFEDDTDVWNVVGLAQTPLHQRAMDFVKERNPKEYDAIQTWLRTNGRTLYPFVNKELLFGSLEVAREACETQATVFAKKGVDDGHPSVNLLNRIVTAIEEFQGRYGDS